MDLAGKTVVAVVTHDYTKIWTTEAGKGSAPQFVKIHRSNRHAHVREAQHHGGHDTSQYDEPYFEQLAQTLAPSHQILLIGHGKGKGNSMLEFVRYVKNQHHEVAGKIIGLLDENIQGLSDQQLLETARTWFSQWFGVPVHYWQASER